MRNHKSQIPRKKENRGIELSQGSLGYNCGRLDNNFSRIQHNTTQEEMKTINGLKDFFISAFSDERGNVSHKRIIAILCFLVLAFAFLYKLFCKNCQDSDPTLVDGLIIICCVAMGATSLDKFSKKQNSSIENE